MDYIKYKLFIFLILFSTSAISLEVTVKIFIYEPFKLGDSIEVDGKKGKVVDINLRYVTLTDEGQDILVPNSLLVSKSLVVSK